MNDMSSVIVPKSDQLNSDDLIAGPRTIRIRAVDIRPGTEQPVSIFFDGDDNKPWKPCKSMSRVLVAAWGPDAKAYVGRSVTIYRDPSVKWGGMDVGGIRVSHLSNIERDMVMALTATKGKRAPYTVKPLKIEQQRQAPADDAAARADSLRWLEQYEQEVRDAPSMEALEALHVRKERGVKLLAKFPDLHARALALSQPPSTSADELRGERFNEEVDHVE